MYEYIQWLHRSILHVVNSAVVTQPELRDCLVL
jgi:hypothetical protein